MELSIVIGTYNRFNMLRGCIALLRNELKNAYSNYQDKVEIFVIDSGSTDGTKEWLIQQPDIVTIVHHRFAEGMPKRSWGNFMNMGFKSALSDWVLMLSDDTFVLPGVITEAKKWIELEDSNQYGFCAFPFHDVHGNPEWKYKVFSLFGVQVLNHGLYNKKALEYIGYANGDDFELYGADSDICFQMIQAGFSGTVAKKCLLLHDMRAHNHPTQTGDVNRIFSKDVRETLVNKWKHANWLSIPKDTSQIAATETFVDGPSASNIVAMLDSIAKGESIEEYLLNI